MGMRLLELCSLSTITDSCPVELATKRSETHRNPAVAPDAPSPSYACPFLRPCARARKTTQCIAHNTCKGRIRSQMDGIQKCLSLSEASPCRCARCSPPVPQARQDGLHAGVQGEDADEHRSVEPYIARTSPKSPSGGSPWVTRWCCSASSRLPAPSVARSQLAPGVDSRE